MFTPVDINNACEFCRSQANDSCFFKVIIAIVITSIIWSLRGRR